MAKKLVCVTADAESAGHDTPHVTEVGIGSLEGAPEYREAVDTVRANLEADGTYFATVAGTRARIEAHACETCGFETVRAVADGEGVPLEGLPDC